MTLKDFFTKYKKVALGFSGGTDSSFLLYYANSLGVDIKPYFIKGDFQPEFELNDAKELCASLNIELKILNINILEDEKVKANNADRCYHCKRAGFSYIKERAAKDGYTILLDGTNADDDIDDRPGFRAVNELEVLSPLKLCGITKSMVRELSDKAGLKTAKKPSYACLATRVLESPLTKESLQLAQRAEEIVEKLGFSDFRVRVKYGNAILEMNEKQQERAKEKWQDICKALEPMFFNNISLKAEPRKASV